MATKKDERSVVGHLAEDVNLPVADINWIPFICDSSVELAGGDLVSLREDLQEARGGGRFDLVEQAIRRAERKYTRHLITGHPGSGKSTELRRLAENLAKAHGGRSFYVVTVDIGHYLDVADVELPDLIAALLGALIDDPVLSVAATKTAEVLWKRLWRWTRSTAPGVAEDLAEGVKGLRILFKQSPGYQKSFREKAQNDVSNALTDLGDLLRELQEQIVPKGYSDLILVVDSLEKIPLRYPDPERHVSNYDLLFIQQLPKLDALPVHLILTFPLSLHCTQTHMRLHFPSAKTVTVPMVRVRAKPTPEGGERPDDVEGFAALHRLLGRRLDLPRVFASNEVIDEAIRASGGCLRDLLRLVVDASYRRDTLPIQLDDVREAVTDQVSNFERALGGRSWLAPLHEIERTGAFPADFDEDHKLLLLHDLIVVEYDSGTWYDVHPFARGTRSYGLARPRPAAAP